MAFTHYMAIILIFRLQIVPCFVKIEIETRSRNPHAEFPLITSLLHVPISICMSLAISENIWFDTKPQVSSYLSLITGCSAVVRLSQSSAPFPRQPNADLHETTDWPSIGVHPRWTTTILWTLSSGLGTLWPGFGRWVSTSLCCTACCIAHCSLLILFLSDYPAPLRLPCPTILLCNRGDNRHNAHPT